MPVLRYKRNQFVSLISPVHVTAFWLSQLFIVSGKVWLLPRDSQDSGRQQEVGEPGEPFVVEQDDENEVWEVIQELLHDERQLRVAYLIYHCGLKPREIVKILSQAFPDVQEIYRLRRIIFERVQRNADYIRWRLDYQPQ